STAVRTERRSDSSNLADRGQTARLNGASPIRLIQHRGTPGLLVLGSGRAWLDHKFQPGTARAWQARGSVRIVQLVWRLAHLLPFGYHDQAMLSRAQEA